MCAGLTILSDRAHPLTSDHAPLLSGMKLIRTIGARLFKTGVAWYWIFNALRLASGILLLPLLLLSLNEADLGMYYLLFTLNVLGPLFDFGILTAVHRAIGSAMGGARELHAVGIAEPVPDASPNYDLLCKLLVTTRWLSGLFGLAVFVVLGIAGTYTVGYRIHETSSESLTWAAWTLTLAATAFESYSSWWNIFLRGMNHVLLSARILVVAQVIRVLISAALLVAGAGLLSIPVAAIVSAVAARFWSRRACLTVLSPHRTNDPSRSELYGMLRVLWPNSWRVGVHCLSAYLVTNANALICMHYFGLAANARYGLSLQLFMIAASVASVWTAVKWPIAQQLRTRGDLPGLRRTLWSRIWLQTIFYLAMSLVVIAGAPFFLKIFAPGKSVLPMPWFALLGLVIFFDMQFSFWGGVIATENRMPFLWPTVISNLCAVALTLLLTKATELGLASLVLAPLVVGLCFNYWRWPIVAARTLSTSLRQYLFSRPPSPQKPAAP